MAVLCLLLLTTATLPAWAEGRLPAWYETTTHLNMRSGPSVRSTSQFIMAPGTRVLVIGHPQDQWAEVVYGGDTLYCATRYLQYAAPYAVKKVAKHRYSRYSLWGFVRQLLLTCVVLYVLRWVVIWGLSVASTLVYKVYWVACIPFYFLNWLQRYAAKPWRWYFKVNAGRTDAENRRLRKQLAFAQIPFYILLTPLRWFNAVYYNLFVHCSLEFINYALEVVDPSHPKEGADDTQRWFLLLPWRILKYPLWHGTLTLVESGVWTLVDTLVPALTLYHGTDCMASESITQSRGRVGNNSRYTGIWNVGGGNYAGNGIYFAPDRATALHYASGSLVVCRVTLGRVLDLGIAPRRIYSECGFPNALNVTRWGLDHDYVTGEWWREDAGWWEYCMYDWQNRYNYSWRIRPLYVLSLSDDMLQRTPGGMHHWLFRRMVIEDLWTWFVHLMNSKRTY